MSKKRKDLSKTKIGNFLTSKEERDDALEEYGDFLVGFDDLFDDDEDDDD